MRLQLVSRSRDFSKSKKTPRETALFALQARLRALSYKPGKMLTATSVRPLRSRGGHSSEKLEKEGDFFSRILRAGRNLIALVAMLFGIPIGAADNLPETLGKVQGVGEAVSGFSTWAQERRAADYQDGTYQGPKPSVKEAA